MRMTLDNRALKDIPLVERTIESVGNEVFVTYIVVGDLDFDLTLKKKYESYDALNESVTLFLSSESNNVESSINWNDDFITKQAKAKKELFNRFERKQLLLPDNGEDFVFDGDVDYMRKWINNL